MGKLYQAGISMISRMFVSGSLLHQRRRAAVTMISVFLLFCFIFMLNIPFALAQGASSSVQATACRNCHTEEAYLEGFTRSVHGHNGCMSCHKEIDDLDAHVSGRSRMPVANCSGCHRDITSRYRRDVHAVKQNMICQDCHRNIHFTRRSDQFTRSTQMKNCFQCHAKEEYALLGHGKSVLEGNQDSAGCSDCHGLHNIPSYNPGLERDAASAREAYTRRCMACHADIKISKRNNMSTKAAQSYDGTYHGKMIDLGFPQRVAGCADCHGGHNSLPQTDPRSTLHPDNLVIACKACHQGIHKRFASFVAHPDISSAKKYPFLYWTEIVMSSLLAVLFLFCFTHAALWWRRVYFDKNEPITPTAIVDVSAETEGRSGRQIQRFSPVSRGLHIVLMFSFFALLLTGIPLKFHDAAWAKTMMGLWGGAYRAGMFHRLAAVVLCFLMLCILFLCLRYLSSKGPYRSLRERLVGPDSLFPNLKDGRDLMGMIRWFFNRGDMPVFDRWTYWQKLDFIIIFSAMTILGGSGLLLWFPEFWSHVLPGWIFNVAVIIHSEMAFLVAIFVFSIHFFNNHLLPGKFPLEISIFTGRYQLENMKREHRLEYERLTIEGRIESLERKKPGALTNLFASALGLGSLIMGLFLGALMIWAAILY